MGRPPLEEHPLEYQSRAIAVRDASPVPASGVSGRSGEGGRQVHVPPYCTRYDTLYVIVVKKG